jgi:hypothetical protein
MRAALGLAPEEVRCTSVDGYRLHAGADTDEVLRQEVFEAHAFIGLLTPSSIASAYVLFELGARWGAGRTTVPLLARGATPAMLPGPLAGKNALSLTAKAQIYQLLDDVAGILGVGVASPASYQRQLAACVTAASEVDDSEGSRTLGASSSSARKLNPARLRNAYLCGASFGNRIGLVPINPADAESGDVLGELLDAAEALGVEDTVELRRYASGEAIGDAMNANTEAAKAEVREKLERFLELLDEAESDVLNELSAEEARWFKLGSIIHKIGALALADRQSESGDGEGG